MPLQCSRCHQDSGLTGTVSGGWWTCGPCEAVKEAEERAGKIERTAKARREVLEEGRFTILIPGKRLPPETTDEEAQRVADENYGIQWTRNDREVIVWCEM